MSQQVGEYNKLVLGEFLVHLNFNKKEKDGRSNMNKDSTNKNNVQIKTKTMVVKNSCTDKKNMKVKNNVNTFSSTTKRDTVVYRTPENIDIKTEDFLRYIIPPWDLFHLGFPVEYALDRSKTIIYRRLIIKDSLNTNNCNRNRNCVNKQQLILDTSTNDFMVNPNFENKWFTYVTDNKLENIILRRSCSRCNKYFLTSSIDNEYVANDSCVYHWGKLRRNFKNDEIVFTCCDKKDESAGCTKADFHVWDGLIAGKFNGPLDEFVSTKPRPKTYNNNKYKYVDSILALDCEMCYTIKGLEVCKVAIVNINGDLIYYTLVKPENKIVDYNSRFSGVYEKDFTDQKYKTLKQVQKDLIKIIFRDTIVIGHGLESDLRVLKLIHKKIIDTSLIFPHCSGLPYKRSLKSLALSYLNRFIQTDSSGHDSREDAKSCIDLMLWKVNNDLKINKK